MGLAEKDKYIAEVLRSIPELSRAALSWLPLSGGITNENFLVTVGQKKLVLRLGGRQTELLGINRIFESETIKLTSALGISPRVIFADANKGILLSQYVEGRTLSPEWCLEEEVFQRIARTIRRLHEIPFVPGRFCVFKTVRDYHKLCLARKGNPLPADFSVALAMLSKIEEALSRETALVPCHNDLLSSNFIDDGKHLWLLDWEYAGMGDLFFDLGNFAAHQELSEPLCLKLLGLYFGTVSDKRHAHFQLMFAVSDMREAMWGFSQSLLSTIDFDYVGYGNKYYQRFMLKISQPGFKDWLKGLG